MCPTLPDLAETVVPRHLAVRIAAVVSDTVVAEIDGELDLHTASLLEAILLPLPPAGVRHIVVDAGNLHFCDVCGFRALSEINDVAVSHGGGVVIARPNRILRRISSLVQECGPAAGTRPIPLYDEVADALTTDAGRGGSGWN